MRIPSCIDVLWGCLKYFDYENEGTYEKFFTINVKNIRKPMPTEHNPSTRTSMFLHHGRRYRPKEVTKPPKHVQLTLTGKRMSAEITPVSSIKLPFTGGEAHL
ncbi:hypothetical protein AVEN_255819-1 [Araneus ventricosus]|uniref:Uncharacterized protein n=1 Tax=Araneus ventricosus TaxID=182803 RepID=A0A4Y2I5I4_ARAVE|nr:hypothetical protein AVEN_255819-1 [Araneus ventricosus]